MNVIKEYSKTTFESIKHIDEDGIEYFSARELMVLLDYKNWSNFKKVIEKAKVACQNSNSNINDNFLEIKKNNFIDYKLSRYACYLIIQNADSRKENIALLKNYFVYQTRKTELTELNDIATNLFIISQTKSKIKKDNIKNENDIKEIYYNIENDVRNLITKNNASIKDEILD